MRTRSDESFAKNCGKQAERSIVAHTDRDERIRIISARDVTAAERRNYEQEPK
jgi:uncharacterized DUF497 family protein